PDVIGPDEIDAPTDADPGPPGGDIVAQLSFASDDAGYTAGAVPAAGGGVVISFAYRGTVSLALADATIPCTYCQVIAKLDATLSHVDWYAYASNTASVLDGGGRDGGLATSPDGSIYWATEGNGDANYSITYAGNRFASPFTVDVVGNTNQGAD